MPTINVDVSEEEKDFLTAMAKLEEKSVAELLRTATFEHLEDYYDAQLGDKPYEGFLQHTKIRPISELLGAWMEED